MDLRLSGEAPDEVDNAGFLSQCERNATAVQEAYPFQRLHDARRRVEPRERAGKSGNGIWFVKPYREHYVVAVEPGKYQKRVTGHKDIVDAHKEAKDITILVEAQNPERLAEFLFAALVDDRRDIGSSVDRQVFSLDCDDVMITQRRDEPHRDA